MSDVKRFARRDYHSGADRHQQIEFALADGWMAVDIRDGKPVFFLAPASTTADFLLMLIGGMIEPFKRKWLMRDFFRLEPLSKLPNHFLRNMFDRNFLALLESGKIEQVGERYRLKGDDK